MRGAALAVWLAGYAAAQTGTDVYYMAFLRPDPQRTLLSREAGERLQAAHMASMRKLAEDGYLVGAGPFEDTPSTIGGLFLIKTESLREAKRLASLDPTVVAHRNMIDVHQWRGPAGIGDEYKRLHKADPKTPEDMGLHPIIFIRPGPKRGRVSQDAADVVDGSMSEGLRALGKSGRVLAAGTVEGEDDFKAIVIFGRVPLKDATEAVRAAFHTEDGALRAEPHQFWSAAHVFPR